MQNITCERSFHRSASDHPSLALSATGWRPGRHGPHRRAACGGACDSPAGCHAFRIVQGARAECSLYCVHQRQPGKEGPMLFCNVSSMLPQYRTQRFSVYGWARAHPSKSTTRSAGSSSEHVVLDRQTNRLPDERTLHATELAAGHRASRRAQARLLSTRDDSEDRRSRPRIELRFTNGWRDERGNGEIVCRSESCGSSKRERNLFFLEIVYAIQFKGTVQLASARFSQPLMSWRCIHVYSI